MEESAHTVPGSPSWHVFISYRRDGGAETAQAIKAELARRGIRAFLDVGDLGPKHFDERLLTEIECTPNFVVLLSPGSLDRCTEEGDWLRREIAHAIRLKKNIVPILKEGFRFPGAGQLPDDIADLPRHNSVRYSHEYFGATMDKLVRFLVETESAARSSGGTRRRLVLGLVCAIVGLSLLWPVLKHDATTSGPSAGDESQSVHPTPTPTPTPPPTPSSAPIPTPEPAPLSAQPKAPPTSPDVPIRESPPTESETLRASSGTPGTQAGPPVARSPVLTFTPAPTRTLFIDAKRPEAQPPVSSTKPLVRAPAGTVAPVDTSGLPADILSFLRSSARRSASAPNALEGVWFLRQNGGLIDKDFTIVIRGMTGHMVTHFVDKGEDVFLSHPMRVGLQKDYYLVEPVGGKRDPAAGPLYNPTAFRFRVRSDRVTINPDARGEFAVKGERTHTIQEALDIASR